MHFLLLQWRLLLILSLVCPLLVQAGNASQLPLLLPRVCDEQELLQISRKKSSYVMQSFLQEHPLIKTNVEDDFGNTSLHYAAIQGDVGKVQALLNAGASVHWYNKEGEQPGDYAWKGYLNDRESGKRGSRKNLQLFGILPPVLSESTEMRETRKRKRISVVEKSLSKEGVCRAIRELSNEKLKNFFNSVPDMEVNIHNAEGCSPLFYAVAYGKWAAIPGLFKKGAQLDFANKNGAVPLDMIEFLYPPCKRSLMLQELALWDRHFLDVMLAFKIFTPEERALMLHKSMYRSCNESFQALLDDDRTLVNMTNKKKNTALHLAVLRSSTDKVALLLKKYGANPLLKNSCGKTALQLTRNFSDYPTRYFYSLPLLEQAEKDWKIFLQSHMDGAHSINASSLNA